MEGRPNSLRTGVRGGVGRTDESGTYINVIAGHGQFMDADVNMCIACTLNLL